MKILIIGGYGPSLINFRGPLLQALVADGHEVFAAAPQDGIDVASALENWGVKYVPVPINRTGMNPLHDGRSLIKLWKTAKKINPDRVLCYTIKPVIYGSMATRLAGVENVYSMITGLGYAFGKTSGKRGMLFKLVKLLYRTSLALNTAVMFQNPDDMNLFKELGIISKNKNTVITNGSGIDLEHFALKPPKKENPITFLCLSRLLREKGVREFAEASMLLKKEYPEVQFRLVGPHDHGPDSISDSELESWRAAGVDCPGGVSDVRPEISAASVYVLPSYREGTPRSVLEALSMGRPVITTDAPGCRETVISGKNGYLIPVRDVQALAEAMKNFIKDPGLIAEMGHESRVLAEKKYDVNKVNKTIMDTMSL